MTPPPSSAEAASAIEELLDRIKEAVDSLHISLQKLEHETGASDSSWSRWFSERPVRIRKPEHVTKGARFLLHELNQEERKLTDGHPESCHLTGIRDKLQAALDRYNLVTKGSSGNPAVGSPPRSYPIETEMHTQPEHDPPTPASPPRRLLFEIRHQVAADRLAVDLEKQWHEEADLRALLLPRRIPVRWQWVPLLADEVGYVANDPVRGTPVFPVLLDMQPVAAEKLRSGDLTALFEVYAGLDSGRLIIVGSVGAGKSAALIMILLEALQHRASVDEVGRAAIPVPVVYPIHDWDPRTQPLTSWLAEKLAVDFPYLAKRREGRTLAAELVDAGAVALFLDGLDEMDASLRPDAIKAIDAQTRVRLVLLCRRDQFETAVADGGRVTAAAVVELQPISAQDVAEYLTNCQRDASRGWFAGIIEHLREDPISGLSEGLGLPLNVAMLRDLVIEPDDVAELCTVGGGGREEVTKAIMDRFIDSRPDKMALGYLASQMAAKKDNPYDLAWWEIAWWTSWSARLARLAVTAIVGLVIGATIGAVLFGPLGQYTVRGDTGVAFGVAYLGSMGFGFAVVAGLIIEFRRPRRKPGPQGNRLSHRFSLVGLLVMIGTTIAVGNQWSFWIGAPIGLAAGAIAGLAGKVPLADPGGTDQKWWWRAVLAKVHLPTGLAAGVPIGLAYGVTKGPGHGLIATAVGLLAFGIIVGFSRPSDQAATAPYTLWRTELRHSIHLGIVTGLTVGCPLGFKNGTAHGPIAGVVAAIGIASMIWLACVLGGSSAWQMSLVFRQLGKRGIPANGMKFLEDTRKQGVLRTVGPLYQFRHMALQDRLTEMYRQETNG